MKFAVRHAGTGKVLKRKYQSREAAERVAERLSKDGERYLVVRRDLDHFSGADRADGKVNVSHEVADVSGHS